MNDIYSPIVFQANFSLAIGNRVIVTGEALQVLGDNSGMYWLYFEGSDDPIAHLFAEDVNKIAGRELLK